MPLFEKGIVNNIGFKIPPGGQKNSLNHVLNDHTYCCQLKSDICVKTGEPLPEHGQICL